MDVDTLFVIVAITFMVVCIVILIINCVYLFLDKRDLGPFAIAILADIGSNGGCIGECGENDCDGYSEECRAWDYMHILTPETPIRLRHVLGEHAHGSTRIKLIVVNPNEQHYVNSTITPAHLMFLKEMN